jgi:vacuolar-type H+-ATPase subunit E/Vma4
MKNGIEINCTYESLLEYYRDELEDKIVETLFH